MHKHATKMFYYTTVVDRLRVEYAKKNPYTYKVVA